MFGETQFAPQKGPGKRSYLVIFLNKDDEVI